MKLHCSLSTDQCNFKENQMVLLKLKLVLKTKLQLQKNAKNYGRKQTLSIRILLNENTVPNDVPKYKLYSYMEETFINILRTLHYSHSSQLVPTYCQ